MKRFGFLDRAVDYLKEAGMEVQLFEGIESDPSVETVMRGAKAMEEFQPDWIVAMGGGSLRGSRCTDSWQMIRGYLYSATGRMHTFSQRSSFSL